MLQGSTSSFYRILCFTVLVFCGIQLPAQYYNFRDYSVSEGLPQAQVHCIYQDEDGFIWAGTDAGVAQFDGHEFKVYDQDNGLKYPAVKAIGETPEALLLLTDSGLVRLNGGVFTVIPFNNTAGRFRAYCMLRQPGSGYLIGTSDGVWSYENNALKKCSLRPELEHADIRVLYNDQQGNVWVATGYHGVTKWRIENNTWKEQAFAAAADSTLKSVRGITADENGALWFATSGSGLQMWDGVSLSAIKLPEGKQAFYFTSAARDIHNNLWFATWGSGVLKYEKSVFKQYNSRSGLPDDVIRTLLPDRDGNMWFGSMNAGLVFFSGEQFSTLSMANVLPENQVRSIVQDEAAGNIWLATGAGITVYDGIEFRTLTTADGLGADNVSALAVNGNMIWALSPGGIVNKITYGTSGYQVTVYQNKEVAGSGDFISLAALHDGSLLIGTVDAGVLRFENGHFKMLGEGLRHTPVWSIHEDYTGTIWVGTEVGVYFLENGIPVRLQTALRKIPDVRITDVVHDSTYVYFSTYGKGIWRYHSQKKEVQYLDKREGLGNNFTSALVWMNKNELYISHLAGIDKVNFPPDGSTLFKHFGKNDGIEGREYSPGAILRARDGKIWIGAANGAVIYDPEADQLLRQRSKPVLRGIRLMDASADWKLYSDSIVSKSGLPVAPVFPYNKNYITFDFTSVQFGTGVNLKYRYKLEGYDKDWSLPVESGLISYANLPPGDYTLQVKTGNSSNVWSEPFTYRFTVSPPFWKTWWFFVTVLLVIAASCMMLLFLYQRSRKMPVIRKTNDLNLGTSRMMIFFASVLYPADMILCNLFDETIDTQPAVALFFGVSFGILAWLSYTNRFIQRNLGRMVAILFPVVVLHLLYLNYINHLSPVTVIALAIACCALGITSDSWRTIAIIAGGTILLAALVAIITTGNIYNPWLFVLAVFTALLVAFLAVIIRQNMMNRLLFADAAINSSWSIVLAAEPSGQIIYASQSVYALLGYKPEELLGDGWWKIRTENQDENERMRSQITNLDKENGSGKSYVTPIKTRSGKQRWIQWVDSALENGIKIGIGQDVTDRREIEERYKHIVESANDIIYTTNHQGYFTYVNELGSRLTGYKPVELLKMRFVDLIPPSHRESVIKFYERQFNRRTVSSYHEFPILHKDGHQSWVGQTVRAMFDENRPGFVRGYQAIARDITENKHYEEELEKLSLVASETINGVLISDPDNRVEWANEGFHKITGYTTAEIRDKRLGDIMAGPKTDLETIEVARHKTARGDGYVIELLLLDKNGNDIWLSISNTPIVDENGKMLKQIEILTDITEKKRYEEQLSRYSTRLEILNKTKQDILESQSVEEMTSRALQNLSKRISYCSRLSMAIFDPLRGKAELHYAEVRSGGKLKYREIEMKAFRSLPWLERNEHFVIHDLTAEAELSASDRENLEYGVRSYLVMPLFVQGELVGSINLGSAQTEVITDEDILLVREVADSMAIAVQQRRYQEIILQKNRDISDSINYSRRIQESLLPPDESLKQELGDAFVFFRPKDVLSGDFYWAETKDNFTYSAVADCTGHGVPGALLSLMAHNLLNQAIQERNLIRPAAILDFVNTGIQHSLNQYKSKGEMLDGLDIALCVFDKENNRVFFSGAINPLWIVRDGMLIEVRGDRYSIGSYSEQVFKFSNHEVELKAGDMIYLFSDGYYDQFGGDNYKKFSQSRLRELVLRLAELSTAEQDMLLSETFESWRRDNPQTDDICIMGIRIA